MPPTVEDRLRDILEAITEIEDMLAGGNLDLFTADKTRRTATERYLEVIREAARRLTDDVKRETPEIVQDHHPPLRSFVQRRIRASS
ncbi:HepT-like ribonuclease domain-containing protein [Bradyrhizobium sp.]|uniref:HepT-like ribonuclease domain-containing protein n=1 Tax=Bradyrhizobium sp. TaxID=376 RepID=UPI0026034B73|nr:HepT-like ribonuclease domain-containing protein [Bradyrhizobium sp.]